MLLRKKKEIEDWLNKYNIIDYELIEDKKYGYVVDVDNDVNLYRFEIAEIKVKFNQVNGMFSCSNNRLKSLEGCPEIVKSFYCYGNKLTSLKYSPKIVQQNFDCSNNLLNSLKYFPKKVEKSVDLSKNDLTIDEIKYLLNIKEDIIINISCNQKLGTLQTVNNFNDLKEKVEEILKIKKEKEILLNIINKKNLNKKSNINKM